VAEVFDFGEMFHVGVRVADIDAAMAELGPGLGLTWAEVNHRQQRVWLPDAGATTIDLRFTYSRQGPQHVELLQGEPGSMWDGRDWPGVHHIGVWVDDVAAVITDLTRRGWGLEIAQLPPDEGYGAFAYLRAPSGFLLEPVSSAIKPGFARWLGGGSL
jgi:catechol 2,3-dioxygenase-like lactoylglutathione lyase family enzyme